MESQIFFKNKQQSVLVTPHLQASKRISPSGCICCLSLFVSVLLITYWTSTIGPLQTKKDAGRSVNPLRSLWFTHPTSHPVDLPLYLWPSVGCTQPSMVLLDQPWQPCVLWPQRRLDPWSWRKLAAAAFVAPRYDAWRWDNVLVVERYDAGQQ